MSHRGRDSVSLDLEDLRVLEAVLTEGSFSKAAVKLSKAQSAVSYHIKKLESELKLELFDRGGYRATLTPTGVVIWNEGRRLLRLAERMESLSEHFVEGWEPRLELVIDGALPIEPVLRALKVFVTHQVPTRVQLKTAYLGGVKMTFERDGADLMVVTNYEPVLGLSARPLPITPMVLVAAADHPLALRSRVDHTDLHEHVELTIRDPSRRSEDAAQFGGDRVFFLNDFATKRQALLLGIGFGWMPAKMVADELASGALRELCYEAGSRFNLTPHLVHPTDRPLGRAGDVLCELIEQAFSTEGPLVLPPSSLERWVGRLRGQEVEVDEG
jgi:DNA-binding transcriptional LysR family regulator